MSRAAYEPKLSYNKLSEPKKKKLSRSFTLSFSKNQTRAQLPQYGFPIQIFQQTIFFFVNPYC